MGCEDDSCPCKRVDHEDLPDLLKMKADDFMALASDLHHMPGTEGWKDKPHRYLYDACAIIRTQAQILKYYEDHYVHIRD